MITPAWNVLVYAIAADDDELARFTGAIDDMRAALTANACNVVVQLHARSKTTRHWFSAGHKEQVDELPVQDSSKPATLTSFLNAANDNFSKKSSQSPGANPTALVLWAHSTGLNDQPDRPAKPARPPDLDRVFDRSGSALGTGLDVEETGGEPERHVRHRPEHYGCCWGPDPNTGRSLTAMALKKAIAASRRHRVDLLGLNACGMAFLEVVYELRGVADVQIASQVEARPWPYGTMIGELVAAPQLTAEQLAIAIVDAVRAEIAAGTRPDAISALRSGSAIDDLAIAVDVYAKRIAELIDRDWPSVLNAVKDAWRVDDPYLVDLVALTKILGHQELKAKIAAAAVAAKFRAMCLAAAASSGHPHANGLSIFCPKIRYKDIAEAYKGLEFRNREWRNFLLKFQRHL